MQFSQRLEEMERRFEALTEQMADPAVINDSAQYRKVTKAQSDLTEVVAKYREWKVANSNLLEARSMLGETDAELRTMAQEEIAKFEPLLAKYEEELRMCASPAAANSVQLGPYGHQIYLFAFPKESLVQSHSRTRDAN